MTKHKLHYVCAAVLLKTDKIIMDNVCIVCVVACSVDDVNDDSTRCIRKKLPYQEVLCMPPC